MIAHWYVYLTLAIVSAFLLWICDKFQIIKSKPLRYFIVIFVSVLLCWGIYDLILGTDWRARFEISELHNHEVNGSVADSIRRNNRKNLKHNITTHSRIMWKPQRCKQSSWAACYLSLFDKEKIIHFWNYQSSHSNLFTIGNYFATPHFGYCIIGMSMNYTVNRWFADYFSNFASEIETPMNDIEK